MSSSRKRNLSKQFKFKRHSSLRHGESSTFGVWSRVEMVDGTGTGAARPVLHPNPVLVRLLHDLNIGQI